MHIFKTVINANQENILRLLKENSNKYIKYVDKEFITCQFGFRPYSLLSKSGARILQKNYKKLNYIQDPEIKYFKKVPKNKKLCLLSITEKIDDIFNEICKKINEFIGKNTFLKFFLKRTLCGCEFGVCYNFECEVTEFNSQNCLFDKDPLLLFSINVKSVVPILAGILIIGLLYIAYLVKENIECIAAIPEKVTKEVLVKGLITCCEIVGKDLSNKILDKVCEFLSKKLEIQINKFSDNLKKYAEVFTSIKSLFDSNLAKKLNEKLSSLISDKIKFKANWKNIIKSKIDPQRAIQINLYLLLCLATFIINFINRKNALGCAKKDSSEYNKNLGKNNMDDVIHDIANKNVDDVQEANYEVNNIKKEKFDEQNYQKLEDESSKSFFYKFRNFNLHSKFVKFSNFILEKDDLIKDIFNLASDVQSCITKEKIPQRCLRLKYPAIKSILYEQLPSILNLIGYSTHNHCVFIYVENKGDKTLENVIKGAINETQKLIIAYGIAKTLEILHSNKIVLRNINSSNIVLDSDYHPYLSDFSLSIQTEIRPSYLICKETIDSMKKEFVAPELKTKESIIVSSFDPRKKADIKIENYIKNQNSTKIDVYSYGVVLHLLFIGKLNFDKNMESSDDLYHKKLQKLINECLNKNADSRPDFIQICQTFSIVIESEKLFFV